MVYFQEIRKEKATEVRNVDPGTRRAFITNQKEPWIAIKALYFVVRKERSRGGATAVLITPHDTHKLKKSLKL